MGMLVMTAQTWAKAQTRMTMAVNTWTSHSQVSRSLKARLWRTKMPSSPARKGIFLAAMKKWMTMRTTMMGAASWAMYVASMNQAMPLVMLGLRMHVPSRRR